MTVLVNTREAKTVKIMKTKIKIKSMCRPTRPKPREHRPKRPRHSLLRRLRLQRPSIMTMQMTTRLSVDSVGTV